LTGSILPRETNCHSLEFQSLRVICWLHTFQGAQGSVPADFVTLSVRFPNQAAVEEFWYSVELICCGEPDKLGGADPFARKNAHIQRAGVRGSQALIPAPAPAFAMRVTTRMRMAEREGFEPSKGF
jgi:hypothetical protein